jgi:hypothetical protein
MSHVDDGRLHAYLDGALESREERLRVEDHLKLCPDCRTRLEAARGDREGAGEILGLLGPEEVRVPPFEELLARRGGEAGGGGVGGAGSGASGSGASGSPSAGPAPSPSRSSGTPRLNRLAWAATVVLALGGGWVARGALMPDSGVEGRRAEFLRSADVAMEASAPVAEAPAAAPPAPVAEAPTPPAEAVPPVAGAPPAVAQAPAAAGQAAREALADRAPEAPAERAQEAPAEQAPEIPVELAEGTLPADRTEVAGAMGRTAMEVEDDTWTPVSPAEAAAFLGHPPLEVDALPWSTMDVSTVQGALVLRTTHPLEDGTLVELLQGPGARAQEARISRLRAEVPTDAPPARAAMASPPTVLSASREGIDLLLRGAVEPEVLEDLLRRIR